MQRHTLSVSKNRYMTHYNLRSRDKHFEVGEQVLILRPDSTSSHMFSKWTGPGTVVQVRSPYSYMVVIDGVRHHFHANHVRNFHVRVESVVCDSLIEDLESKTVNTSAVVYKNDTDFGHLSVVPSTLTPPSSFELPSKKIDPATINHLNPEQQTELLVLLDKYRECFSGVAGFTDAITHTITLKSDFKPRRLHAHRTPEKL